MKHLKMYEQFINEFKQVGPVYHFTTLNALEAILSMDTMSSKQYDHVSFTRNPMLKFYDRHIRIEFDGDAMSNRFHIEPYMYDEDKDPLFQSGFGDEPGEPRMTYDERRNLYGDEREERVPAPMRGIKRYIKRIDVKRKFDRQGNLDTDFMNRINGLVKRNPGVEFLIDDRFLSPVEIKHLRRVPDQTRTLRVA